MVRRLAYRGRIEGVERGCDGGREGERVRMRDGGRQGEGGVDGREREKRTVSNNNLPYLVQYTWR